MSTNQNIPEPPEDATEREKQLWKELINRIRSLKTGARDALERDTLQREFSEGDEVDTPEGVGVVVEIRTEDFEGPDGDTVEASDDSPTYIVGVESGAATFKASEITSGEIETDIDNPEDDLAGESDTNADSLSKQDVLQETTFGIPDSWQDSTTPNRVILLKAWAGLGGRFTSCVREMRGELVGSPDRFCGSMKDRVLQWEGWRQGGD